MSQCTIVPSNLASSRLEDYLFSTLHCTTRGVTQMVALIEKFLDAMFAPLARELERLPPAAMRFSVFF